MSKADQKAAEQAAADAEGRALLAEQALRHQREAEEDRVERERLLQDFRAEIERDRRNQVQASLDATAAVTPPVTPPRDEATGRWLPAAPQPEPEPDLAAVAAMDLSTYSRWRQQAGIDGHGIEQTGRTGKHLSNESGFPSWNDHGDNRMVFRSTLEDQRQAGSARIPAALRKGRRGVVLIMETRMVAPPRIPKTPSEKVSARQVARSGSSPFGWEAPRPSRTHPPAWRWCAWPSAPSRDQRGTRRRSPERRRFPAPRPRSGTARRSLDGFLTLRRG